MNAIPQFNAIGPYNYDRNKNYAKRQVIGQTSGKMHLILNKNLCNLLK